MVRLILNFKEKEDEKLSKIKEVFTSLRQSSVLYYLNEPQNPTSIAMKMNISRTAVTFTLNKFLELGIINKTKKGKEVFYSLNEEELWKTAKEIFIKNMKHRASALKEEVDYDSVNELFDRKDFKEMLSACYLRVAEEKKYPAIKAIDDFLNTLHILYVNAALNKKIVGINPREILTKMNKELKKGYDALMKIYLTQPAENYKELLEYFKN